MASNNTSSDEIDLKEIFLNTILVIKSNFLLFLGAFAFGTLLGYTYSILGTKYYDSRMVLAFDILNTAYVDELGDNLDDIIDDNNLPLLSQSLGLSVEDAEKVRSIEMTLIEKPIQKDNLPIITYVSVSVKVWDVKILPALQKGIINYLENNEFVKIRVAQRKDRLSKMISTVDEEIVSLEKFKTDFYSGDFVKRANGDLMFDPTDINSKIVELTDLKIKFQHELDLANSVQVVEGFTAFNNPASPKKSLSLTAGALLGVLFVALIIGFKSVRSLVELAEESKKS